MGGEAEAARVAHRRADPGGVEARVVDLLVDAEDEVVVAPRSARPPRRPAAARPPCQPSSPLRCAASESWSVSSTTSTPARRAALAISAHRAGAVRVGRVQVDDAGQVVHGWVVSEDVSHPDSFGARATLEVGGETYEIFRLDALQAKYDVARLPYSLKVLLENLLRNGRGRGRRGAWRSWVADRRAVAGDRLHARARADAGLHRRARRSSTWPRCATRWTSSAATRRRSTRSCRSSW